VDILFLTDNFPPEVNAPASRTFEHCREWVKAGHKVTVVTCNPNFPDGKLFKGYRNPLLPQRETIEGIEVVRVWSYITANEGFAKRVLDYLSFAFTSFLAGLRVPADVIVATSPQFFTTLSGAGLSLIKRRPWIFELRDLWPESIAALGAMKNSAALRWLERLELALYRKASRVVAVTDAFRRNLIERGIDGAKIGVVTNGVLLDTFAAGDKDPELVRRFALQGKTAIAYIGTHGAAHSLGFILDCAAELRGQPYHFLFVGSGAERQALLAKAGALALDNVSFVESVPKAEVVRFIATCDLMLVPLKKADVFKTVIPSKIFEAAAMRRPILLGVDGQARQIVEEFGAGRYFEPENKTAFLEALEAAQDPAAIAEMKAGCDALARAYDRRRLAEAMLNELKAVSKAIA
jgi:glycosyltransferase involved in cell wall biosynthesis